MPQRNCDMQPESIACVVHLKLGNNGNEKCSTVSWMFAKARRFCPGFNISLEPGFSPSRLCWMLAYGGIYAVANLRCCHMLCSEISTIER